MENFMITPKLLHKDSEEDVLINHPRPALPLQIKKCMADKWMQAGLNGLLALYQADEENADLLHLALTNNNRGLTSFFGRTLPVDPAWEPCRALPYQIIESEFSRKQLESAYADINKEGYSIAKLFRSTSYQMINQADHYFFYKKAHEHVPGIMLIEVQRQAVYMHVYTMTPYVRGEVTISLGKVHCEFYGYVDLMYPLELVVDDMQEEGYANTKKIPYRVAFFQRNKLVAIIDSVVDIIDMKQFNRLRNLFLYEKNDHSYTPIDADKVHCKLIDAENKEYVTKCIRISRNQCITVYDSATIDNVRAIKVSGNGFTFLSTVELERRSEKDIIWRLPPLNQEQLMDLGAIIKRGFILETKEGCS